MLRHRSSNKRDNHNHDGGDIVHDGAAGGGPSEAVAAPATAPRHRVAFADEATASREAPTTSKTSGRYGDDDDHDEMLMMIRKPLSARVVDSSLLTATNPSSSSSVGGGSPIPATATTAAEDEDLQSVGSCSYTSLATNPKAAAPKWSARYDPPPVVSQSSIMALGILCFLLACTWPPLILLVAYVASKLVPYSFRLNDDAAYRRRQYREFASDDSHPAHFYSPPDGVSVEEAFWVNDRGMALSTMIWRPAPACQPSEGSSSSSPSSSPAVPKAVVCFCHGYSDNLSYSKKMEYQRLAKSGIAVVGIEYEGHGRSDGALCLIESWERMVGDVAAFFQETLQRQFPGVPAFLMGESMGGAVAYSVYNRTPELYRGVVFVCPMCKISDDMLPPQFVIDALKYVVGPTGSESSWIGRLPIAPSKSDLYETAHHVPDKAEQIYRCPTSYGRNPRLATARELLHATSQISASLKQFDAPFLIVHGRDDRVTDPQLSLGLYRESPSVDKSIRLYDGMWHGITSTEPDDNIDRVFRDCTDWILGRCSPSELAMQQ